MGISNEIRLVAIDEVPRPVENSLYQAFSADHVSLVLAYHVQQDGVIAVLNRTVDCPCASIRFDKQVAMRMDWWNDESTLSHPLGVHGLSRNVFYQVRNSDWIPEIQSALAPLEIASAPLKHYVFAFRARVVQIVACSFAVTVERRSLVNCVASV
jgi:hypothetical protein